MVRTVVLGLVALLLGSTIAGAAINYPPVDWVSPSGGAIIDTVCSSPSWRDTVYFTLTTAPVGTVHVALPYDWVSYWSVECPPDDDDVGVYVWWVPIHNSIESDSMLVRQNTSWTSYIPAKCWYFRGANATADSTGYVRYQFRYEGKPTAN